MSDGDPIIIGQNNSGSVITYLQNSPLYSVDQGTALVALSTQGYGIITSSINVDGVRAVSQNGSGITASSQNGNGVHGTTTNPSGFGVVGDGAGWGGYFNNLIVNGLSLFDSDISVYGSTDLRNTYVTGTLSVFGALFVFGLKGAAVPHPDGSYRALYCLESPESWFEDFGRATIVRGKAKVKLDPRFVAVVRSNDYHIFLSPEGESEGLYVSRRTRGAFEVLEQGKGTSTLRFSYRVVARRKDVTVRRFEKVKLPDRPKIPTYSKPKTPKPPEIPSMPRIS